MPSFLLLCPLSTSFAVCPAKKLCFPRGYGEIEMRLTTSITSITTASNRSTEPVVDVDVAGCYPPPPFFKPKQIRKNRRIHDVPDDVPSVSGLGADRQIKSIPSACPILSEVQARCGGRMQMGGRGSAESGFRRFLKEPCLGDLTRDDSFISLLIAGRRRGGRGRDRPRILGMKTASSINKIQKSCSE